MPTRNILTGELDLLTPDQARDAIERKQGAGRDVVCDLAEVTFIDVNGICVLLVLAARARDRGGLLTVVNPPVIVGRFLRVFGLDDGLLVSTDPPVTGTAPASLSPDRAAVCNATARARRGRSAPGYRTAKRVGH